MEKVGELFEQHFFGLIAGNVRQFLQIGIETLVIFLFDALNDFAT